MSDTSIAAIVCAAIAAVGAYLTAKVGKKATDEGSVIDFLMSKVSELEATQREASQAIYDLQQARKKDRRSFRTYIAYLLGLLRDHAPHITPDPMPDDLNDD